MNTCKAINSILIYGGRNDELRICFNDLYLLSLENLFWLKVEVDFYEPRYSFSSEIYNDKIYIFGGLNFEGYIDNNLIVFDLNGRKRGTTKTNEERKLNDVREVSKGFESVKKGIKRCSNLKSYQPMIKKLI